MSERGVRRTVIARKVCSGTQSNDALLVREVLQSVIESLRLLCADPVAKRTEALDADAMDSGICIPDVLFPSRHTRQNSVGDGRGPVAFRKSGEKPHLPFSQWEDSESQLRLRTRPLEKLRCNFAQMLRCRGQSTPRSGVDWGTPPLRFLAEEEGDDGVRLQGGGEAHARTLRGLSPVHGAFAVPDGNQAAAHPADPHRVAPAPAGHPARGDERLPRREQRRKNHHLRLRPVNGFHDDVAI